MTGGMLWKGFGAGIELSEAALTGVPDLGDCVIGETEASRGDLLPLRMTMMLLATLTVGVLQPRIAGRAPRAGSWFFAKGYAATSYPGHVLNVSIEE
jgi:hypothetical protein